MKTVEMLTKILLLVGGVNWGLVGAIKFDLVAAVFGAGSLLANVIYILVGISAVVQAALLFAPKSASAN